MGVVSALRIGVNWGGNGGGHGVAVGGMIVDHEVTVGVMCGGGVFAVGTVSGRLVLDAMVPSPRKWG